MLGFGIRKYVNISVYKCFSFEFFLQRKLLEFHILLLTNTADEMTVF